MKRSEAENIQGVCVDCKEWTTLADTCCGAGVYFEGSIYSPDDIEDEPSAPWDKSDYLYDSNKDGKHDQ